MSKYSKENLYKILEKVTNSVLPSIIDECVQNSVSINLKVNSKGVVTITSTEKSTINDKKLKRKHIIKHGLGFISEKSQTNRIQ